MRAWHAAVTLSLVSVLAGHSQDLPGGQAFPVANFADPLPTNPAEATTRLARGQLFTLGSPIDDEAFGGSLVFVENSLDADWQPPLPVKRSDAIVLGIVVLAQAFVSENRRTVYSEFEVRVEHVIKDVTPNADALPRSVPGDVIAVLRSGGGLRLPSGDRVVAVRTSGLNYPQVGQSYVFFLERVRKADAFTLVTAYAIKAGTVNSLDSAEHYPWRAETPLEKFLAEIDAVLASGAER